MTLEAIHERPADPARISIEALDQEIVSLASRMTAEEYHFLVLLRTFDERGGWLKWGSMSCADWLHWRCDLSLSAAREKVRVAHALKALPLISAAFAGGRLSYSKARALTRVASRVNEADLLDFALQVSAALVEQRCQQLKNVEPGAADVARRAYERRSLSAFRDRSRGSMTVTVELPLEDGELILNALDKVLADSDAAADASTSYRTRQADALVALCKSTLAGDSGALRDSGDLRGGLGHDSETNPRSTSTADQYQVVIHIDERALEHTPQAGARSDLPAETVRRLSCDGSVVQIGSRNGVPMDIGRKRRTVPAALKRALWARDQHCRFPGCTHSRFVDAHHLQHWAQGGETRLDNLMLLCDHHHRLVHEGGFQVFVDHEGNHAFRRPDGRAVPACGYRPEDQVDDDVNEADPSDSAETSAMEETSAEGPINPDFDSAPAGDPTGPERPSR
jgi:hypothetical protein